MPDIFMDVDVALSEVPVNIMPLLDDTDFKTREVAIAYNAAGMDLVWNFVTSAGAFTQTAVTPTTGGNYDWTHQGDGMYTIEITATGGASINNDTEGYGWFTGFVTGVLPWRGPVICFRAAALNDALIDGGAFLEVDVTNLALQEIDTFLSGIHGSGSWETEVTPDIPTAEEIDLYLSGIHGSGSWETAIIDVPTVEEIDVYLSGLHGSGVWEDTIVDVPTVEEIDIYLSGLHGSGIWEDTIVDVPTVEEINDYLSGVHGSGIWETADVSGIDVPTVEEIDNYLSGIHGSGIWEDTLVDVPTTEEIDDYLSGIHGSGNWETADISSIVVPTVEEIDNYLSGIHGSGSWEDMITDVPTVEEMDTYLSGIHGSGLWDAIASMDVPTVEEIDSYLSGIHGSGIWEDTVVDVPTTEDIDLYLSGIHGSGTWEDSAASIPTVEEIDDYLSGIHGSGVWDDTIVDVPTVSEIDDYLSGIHGSGTWEDSGTSAPTVGEIDDYLAGIHGSGNWESGDYPTVTEIDDTLTSSHGSGPWTTGGSTGSNVVTITTENDDSDILGGVVVEVRSSGGSILIDRKYSNTSTGQLAFNLDDGQYELYTFQTGTVSFNNPYYFDVDDDEDITLTGTPIATPVPGAGDLVRVYAYVSDLGINPQLGVELIIKPSGNGYVDGDFVFSKGGLTALSDSDGYVYLDIIGSTPVEIKVPKAGFEYFTVTPASGVLDIADLS